MFIVFNNKVCRTLLAVVLTAGAAVSAQDGLGTCYNRRRCQANDPSATAGTLEQCRNGSTGNTNPRSWRLDGTTGIANCLPFGTCYSSNDCTVGDELTEGVPSTMLFTQANCEANIAGESWISVRNNAVCDSTITADVLGDPHFKTFTGHNYDYQGECDLVLIHNPLFGEDGVGLDIHIRTTRFNFFSFVESVAIGYGGHTLEIDNKASVTIDKTELMLAEEITSFAGYEVAHSNSMKHGKTTHIFEIKVNESDVIKIHVWDMFVGAFVHHGSTVSAFQGSNGMMGDFTTGDMVGRDGSTVFTDPAAFAAEWQVRNDGVDPILFQEARIPQHPQACFLPEQTERELVSDAMRSLAEEACEHTGSNKAACIYDVIATGNLEIADAEVY